MYELNVLQLAVLISNGYRYFLFIESSENDTKDPFRILIKIIPFQKLQDAKAVHLLYGDSAYLMKSLIDYELLFNMAQGISGIKYMVNTSVEYPKLDIKKAIKLVN